MICMGLSIRMKWAKRTFETINWDLRSKYWYGLFPSSTCIHNVLAAKSLLRLGIVYKDAHCELSLIAYVGRNQNMIPWLHYFHILSRPQPNDKHICLQMETTAKLNLLKWLV